MLLLFVMAVVIWVTGAFMRVPVKIRLSMLALLWLAVIGLHLALPDGHPLRVSLGGDARGLWAIGAAGGIVLGYTALLRALRQRGSTPDTPQQGTFSEAELDRYARHIMLREIGGAGQKRLKGAKVLVIGAGGLGSPAILYLAASGVGVIGVIDADMVEASNLQRQIIHAESRIGMPKVFSAEVAVRALNPFVEFRPYHRRFDENCGAGLVADYDLILDGTDNFDTRYLVNRLCVAAGKPLISAAITQWEGQIGLYDPARGGPCYECVFPTRPADGLAPSCAEAGVAAPLPGVVGAMMAAEAVKHITGAGQGLAGKLVIYDALYGETRMIGAKRRADCACCGAIPASETLPKHG